MKLEDQVCSLILAKKLKKLGIDQVSLFSWAVLDKVADESSYAIVVNNVSVPGLYSAFTVAELGKYLKWELLYMYGFPDELKSFIIDDRKEADCRAKMLIYLIENGLINHGS